MRTSDIATGSGQLRIGIHSGQLHGSVKRMIELWRRAEALDYDWISLFDFLRPWAFDEKMPCFEGTTLLAALAQHTHRIRCGLLVSPVTWRHPALMANVASTLDHVTNGRLEFGVGLGGADRAYEQYGIPFPPIATRAEMLDEACLILRRLWSEPEVTFEGAFTSLSRATLEPKPRQHNLPLVVGGDGLRWAIPIAAKYADIWNALPESPQAYSRKIAALHAACVTSGRDPSAVRKSLTFRAIVSSPRGDIDRQQAEQLATLPRYQLDQYLSFGTVDDCVRALTPYVEMGARDLLLAVRDPIDWATMDLFATEVANRLRDVANASP